MKIPTPEWGRRGLLLALPFGLGALAPGRLALAATGITALDDAAPAAMNPAAVLLVAISKIDDRLFAVGEHGVIIYSNDHGVTWTQASVPVDLTITCIAFATPLLGWAAGHYGVILATSDGGKTWTEQLNGMQANQLTLQAAQTAVAQNFSSPGMPLAIKRGNIFVQRGPSRPFFSILVVSPQNVFIFGADRMVMVTQDGGKSWADWSLHVDDALSHNLYDARMIGPDIYIAAEAGKVFCSTDNGNSFLSLTSPAAATFYDIFGTPDGGLIVLGVAGTAFRSADGGKSWTPLTLASTDNLVAGTVLRSGLVLVATVSGQGFASTDNGRTFHPVSGLPPVSIFDFTQAADASLVFVGASGVSRIQPAAITV